MELLDVVTRDGLPTGEVVERCAAHARGIFHRTSHVWIFRKRAAVEVLLQKRSANKDSYPGCYDISSAGHIPAGSDFIPSALRELREELGITAAAEELLYCGRRLIHFEAVFHGRDFIDNQVSNIYMLWRDVEPDTLSLQAEEVESVLWLPFDLCCEKVKNAQIPNCIVPEELDILRQALRKQGCLL
jgi:isopentenyldiphosphate isomerase